MQVVLFASLRSDIQTKCPQEFNLYENDISKYLIRIEDDIRSKGCQVIPIYASIIKSENFEILDKIEENSEIINQLISLFKVSKKFSNSLFSNNVIKNLIIENSLNDNFMHKLYYLMKKKLHSKNIKQIITPPIKYSKITA